MPTLPYTPGSDAAGVVEAVGEGVSHVAVGDRVYTAGTLSGAYAELTLCNESQTHPLPQSIDYEQGAAVNIPYSTAYRALFQRARIVSGEVVLVHGASGSVGIAALQLARAAEVTIIGTSSTERGRALVAEQGAHHVLDHGATNYLEQAVALTGGRGIDVILEMLANANLGNDLEILAQDGRVVVIGSRGEVQINPRELIRRDASILGMGMLNVSAEKLANIHTAIRTGLEDGSLRPIVGQKMPLADAPHAHEAVLQPGSYGKIILVP